MNAKNDKYRRRRIKVYKMRALIAFVVLVFLVLGALLLRSLKKESDEASVYELTTEDWKGAPTIDVQLLTPNKYSRPETALRNVKGVVIHYTANPGTGAQANRDYFEGLKDSHETEASSHFVIGLDGEVIQCIPTNEWAYASNTRNKDTISIEVCHPDESGQFNQASYDSLVQLTGWLADRFDLEADDIIRHYDVTGKICPKYFVEHEDAWAQFKTDAVNKRDEIKAM